MSALTSKKAIIGILSVSSIVLAGTINDYRSHKVNSVVAANEELIPVERSVASSEERPLKVAQVYLPVNAENSQKINTTWEITRIVGADEKVTFDKFAHSEDAHKSIKVKFELVGTSLVKVNNDKKLEYYVSLLSDFGTIALYKRIGNGFEILEAKRVQEVAEKANLVVAEEVELVLERALNQGKSNKVLIGNDVSGQVSLSSKSITGLEVELRNPNGETQNVQIDAADLMDGGAFKAEINGEEVSGVVLNNGKDGYRISFVTGPIAGAMLNFVTKEQMEKIQETERDQTEAKEQQQEMVNEEAPKEVAQVEQAPVENNDQQVSKEEVQEASKQAIEERKDVAAEAQSQEVLTAEEVQVTAQQNGFAF